MAFTVHLKQHTPMIHFDHRHKGASLRATELKPKLDRYMNPHKDKHPRYQIRVIPSGHRKGPPERKPHSLYFGNQGVELEKRKYAVSHDQGVTLQFETYFDKSLEEEIRKWLPQCLALENFGSRQNKGFGCFYFQNPQQNGWPSIEAALKGSGKCVYYFEVPNGEKQFDCIDTLYRAMKGGINETFGVPSKKKYLKSLLWQYLNQGTTPNKIWEKRFMKLHMAGRQAEINDITAYYFRALLGTADLFTFKEIHIDKMNIHVTSARMDGDYGDSGNIPLRPKRLFKLSHPKIARFKSPITFKPVGNRVFIVLLPETYRENGNPKGRCIQGQWFTCSHTGGKKLQVPQNFDLKGFMDFVADTVNHNKFGKLTDFPSANRLKAINIQRLG